MRTGLCFLLIISLLAPFIISQVYATVEIAEETGKSCAHCHLDPSGGGELTKAGKDYLQKMSKSEDEKQKELLKPGNKFLEIIRLIAGYLHILTAIFWFGTILYVHIILKPSYAAHGLPKGEVRLGLVSMFIMAVTGTILSYFRITSLSILWETRFGVLLIIKVILFLIMAGSALYAVLFIGPRLKKKKETGHVVPEKGLTTHDLLSFNGSEGRAVYFAYKGQIFDVSQSKFWRKGSHFGRHNAGADLTDMLNQAPHGEEKIFEMPQAGKLSVGEVKKLRPHYEKIFYILAYMNLILVFAITLILALWRWW
ncbi:MAG: CopD family protein [Candidatus Aminicenantes bacterium]|nr:CopD family protein [Candidatus Aminicenantes bacterium]